MLRLENNQIQTNKIFVHIFIGLFFICSCPFFAFAQSADQSVELTGDTIEYLREKNEIFLSGHVEIKYQDTELYCDQATFNRNTQQVVAKGNVFLITEHGELSGDELNFDYATMSGDFMGAKIYAHPYYGGGERISIEEGSRVILHDAYLTTSDYDKPEYRIVSKRIEIYPDDRVVARHVKLRVSDTALMYLPRYTHYLDDTKPKLTFTPGFDSDWGIFLLTQYRFYSKNKKVIGTLHADYRELLDFGSGAELEYRTDDWGKGKLDLYFTHERKIDADRIWDDRITPTKERDRYKIEWRHKWILDQKTTAVWQYYKLSDRNFLKDFFEAEFREDSAPDTFFSLTRSLPKGTLSVLNNVRVNRFVSTVERLPEIRYDLTNAELLDTGIYFRNTH